MLQTMKVAFLPMSPNQAIGTTQLEDGNLREESKAKIEAWLVAVGQADQGA